MTIEDMKNAEEECMQKNAWKVTEDLCCRVHMEPGPAGDLMMAMVTEKPEHQFFYNTD